MILAVLAGIGAAAVLLAVGAIVGNMLFAWSERRRVS